MYQHVKAAVLYAVLCGCGLTVMGFSATNYVTTHYFRLHPTIAGPATSERYIPELFLLFVFGTVLAVVGFGRALDELSTG